MPRQVPTVEEIGYRFEDSGPWQGLQILKNGNWYSANREEAELFWRYGAAAIRAEKAGMPFPPIR